MTLLALTALAVAACGAEPAQPSQPPAALPLDLQVRNSGLPGGYLWLSSPPGSPDGRWHRFGMVEFICVTCPMPAIAGGPDYDLAVFDQSCHVRARYQTAGGQLLIEIDPGPAIRLVQAPPLGDWMPSDSPPANPAGIHCSPP